MYVIDEFLLQINGGTNAEGGSFVTSSCWGNLNPRYPLNTNNIVRTVDFARKGLLEVCARGCHFLCLLVSYQGKSEQRAINRR